MSIIKIMQNVLIILHGKFAQSDFLMHHNVSVVDIGVGQRHSSKVRRRVRCSVDGDDAAAAAQLLRECEPDRRAETQVSY